MMGPGDNATDKKAARRAKQSIMMGAPDDMNDMSEHCDEDDGDDDDEDMKLEGDDAGGKAAAAAATAAAAAVMVLLVARESEYCKGSRLIPLLRRGFLV